MGCYTQFRCIFNRLFIKTLSKERAVIFKRNLHNLDRLVRVIIGLICVYFGFIDTSYLPQTMVATLIGVLGVVNLFAAITMHCPLYGLTGISTYKECKELDHES